MTQADKDLLLIDLCSRLPYRPKGVELYGLFDPKDIIIIGYTGIFVETHNDEIPLEKVRLYLRPISSITEEEYEELKNISGDYGFPPLSNINDWEPNYVVLDWLNSHFFDYRDLIEKGLALEAPEDMYN